MWERETFVQKGSYQKKESLGRFTLPYLRCVRFDRQRHEGAGKEDDAKEAKKKRKEKKKI